MKERRDEVQKARDMAYGMIGKCGLITPRIIQTEGNVIANFPLCD